jgi:membrane-associated phospholipid phosphatase
VADRETTPPAPSSHDQPDEPDEPDQLDRPHPPVTAPSPLTLDRLADRIGRLHPSLDRRAHDLLGQLEGLDTAVYRAVATSPTPDIDRGLQRLSDAANYSKLWFAIAGALALGGGRRGRRAAVDGVVAIGVASLVANRVVKPIVVRGRPDRDEGLVVDRLVRMPASRSFPSGHTASAFAFAAAVSNSIPPLAFPLTLVATAVGYSRVHTGVHFPADVLFGSVIGAASGETASWGLTHLRRRRAPAKGR